MTATCPVTSSSTAPARTRSCTTPHSHKNFGKTCGVIPNATWVRLLPRSRTQRAMVSSLLESRGIVRSIHSAAIRARRRVRARIKQSRFYTQNVSGEKGLDNRHLAESSNPSHARKCPPPRPRDRRAGCPLDNLASDSISSSVFSRSSASAPAPSTRLWMTCTSATSPVHNPPAPCAPLCGDMCIKDMFFVKSLDKLSPNYTRAENCTPFTRATSASATARCPSPPPLRRAPVASAASCAPRSSATSSVSRTPPPSPTT